MPIKERITSDITKWIDVSEPSVAEMEALSIDYSLNPQMVRDCLQPEHLPKYEYDEEGNVHFLILRFYVHGVNKKESNIQELTDKIAIFYNEQIIITIHKTDTPFLAIISKRIASKPVTISELLSKIIWQALETFDDPANRLSEQVDFYESQVMLKKTSNDISEALFYLKRQASLSLKILMLMLEPINHIRVEEGKESLLQDVRDQHLKIQTLYNQILDEVNNLLTISMSFAAQRTNEVMRVLTLFSVFFMPLTFIVGIYGMNFDFMPELRQKWGYPGVLLLMSVITFVIYKWFRQKKWL